MVRISAIFIAACMVLIAASFGFVLYLRFGLTGAESALVGLGVLTALAVYNAVAARSRDRTEMSNQMADLSRGAGDLGRQVAEYGRRLNALDTKVEAVLDRALAAAQPLASEIEELSRLVKQLADTVAAHDVALAAERTASVARIEPVPTAPAQPEPATVPVLPPQPASRPVQQSGAFAGLDQDAIVAAVRAAIEANTIELYLQPVVTLPQRKVRFYEAMSRLKTDAGEIVPAGDFLAQAEAGALMPKLDNLSVFRCVQVVRRLLIKNREVGLFCNLSRATLAGADFPQFLEFADANRAIAPSLVFEFTQGAVRAMGPIEHESLAALADRGFRFSIDNVVDLRMEPRDLVGRGFRFVKVPAMLLLNRVGAASTDIHPADLSDLLGRFGIDLIAEKIERESTVVDLLDYDVRFGQGFLFSPPRPVRAEALQGMAERPEPRDPAAPQPADAASAARTGGIAQLLRTGSGRT
jgi:cyclic-di-GMP phosphodiesterase TipF (flagellum assembly factor)